MKTVLVAAVAEALAALEAVEQLHRPKDGWELEWKKPEEALAEGWPFCEGCTHATPRRYSRRGRPAAHHQSSPALVTRVRQTRLRAPAGRASLHRG
jgi:hypothetical protein